MENNNDGPFTGPLIPLNETYWKLKEALDKAEFPLRQTERRIALGAIQENKRSEVIKNRRSIIDDLERYHELLGRATDYVGKFFNIMQPQGLSYPVSSLESLKELRRLMLTDIEVLKKEDEEKKI